MGTPPRFAHPVSAGDGVARTTGLREWLSQTLCNHSHNEDVMTDQAEKDALEWLHGFTVSRSISISATARTLKGLLAQLRLPEKLTAEPSRHACGTYGRTHRRTPSENVLRVVREELTKPKTCKVETWRVEYAFHDNGKRHAAGCGPYDCKAGAEEIAGVKVLFVRQGESRRCIAGYHRQDVRRV